MGRTPRDSKRSGVAPVVRRRLSLAVGILGALLSLASIINVVPRIRLVEALSLFATAFGAGAALTEAVVRQRGTAE